MFGSFVSYRAPHFAVASCIYATLFALGDASVSHALQDAQVREVAIPFKPAFINQTELSPQADGSILITTTGVDSFLEFDLPIIERREELSYVAMDYFSPQGITRLEVRVRADGPWPPPVDAGSLDRAEGWVGASLPLSEPGNVFWQTGNAKRLRIDFGQQSGRSLRIRNFRLRTATPEELRGREETERILKAKRQTADSIQKYLEETSWEAGCEVRIEGEWGREQEGVIRGFCTQPGSDIWLIERRLHEPTIWKPQPLDDAIQPVLVIDAKQCDSDGKFTYRFPTDIRNDQRILSRWQIVRLDRRNQFVIPISPARYAESLTPPVEQSIAASPQNLKGLNGISPVFGLDELSELGVGHLVLNVVVTHLIEASPIEGADSFQFGGKQWWVRPGRIGGIDQMARYASENNILLAAIILLPTTANDMIIHPEANTAGIYAMPNFADEAGAEKYAATLYYLTRRYSGRFDVGKIDHWILHNEVDFGWVWTNMGEQPLEVFLDSYIRSMRIASFFSSASNRDSRVFISLTHHWNVPEDLRMRTYAPRTMLERLADFSGVEGDFPWGVAYHPYPENLFDGRPWFAKSATPDPDTPRITMSNLEVLRDFLERPEMLDQSGNRRMVLLSEQGYHTDGYGDQAQRQQAAALLYTWQRLRETNFVFAYDYHRWVDAADEGGLLLGLRTLPTPEKRAGDKKLGWDVFRAIGTEEEARYRDQLKEFPLTGAK